MTSPHKTTMLTPIASHAPQPQPAPYPHITAITASHCLLLHHATTVRRAAPARQGTTTHP